MTHLSAGGITVPRRPRPAPPGQRAGPAPWWPLLVVLAVQAVLSLRLVWSATAFQDEALYLRAGHLEWAHWLHHAPVPGFGAYFSGAPVLYPPLAAAADSLGGLAGARLLSLCFMLGVTGLLWASTAGLYGRRAALLASGLFATLAGTQFLGAFATFDAMALFLLALATWLAVRAATRATAGQAGGSRSRAALLAAAGLALAAANAVTYPTVLFTPVVLVVAALAARREQPGRRWLTALAIAGGTWLMLAGAAIAAGGRAYWRGLTASTLARPPAGAAVTTVLRSAYVWTSLIIVLAVLGAAMALAGRADARGKPLPAVLAAAALLAPAGQAVLHTTVSLHKHVVPGAWFAAIAAGYAMARLSRVDPGHGWAAVMALPIAAATLFGSLGQATTLFRVWPDSAAAIAVLRSAVRTHPGQYLAEDYDVEAYYLRDQVPWPRWSGTWYFRYGQAAPGPPSFAAAISRHYFSLVILDFGDTVAADVLVTADMRRAGGYYVLARAGPFTVWAARVPGSGGARGRH
jgi:4-amino-4-deoxy-L-arabinose transferase-like glycosyltransferase